MAESMTIEADEINLKYSTDRYNGSPFAICGTDQDGNYVRLNIGLAQARWLRSNLKHLIKVEEDTHC